jgi:hypothetical protein
VTIFAKTAKTRRMTFTPLWRDWPGFHVRGRKKRSQRAAMRCGGANLPLYLIFTVIFNHTIT